MTKRASPGATERPLKIGPIFGLLGILLAALTAEFNDGVTSTSIADVQGGLGISHDQGTWLISLYATAQTIGMTQATFWALTFSIRRWVLIAIGLCFVTTVSIPLTSNLTVLYTLRILEGLSAGFTIPLLLAVALQALPPPTRLYGLSAYALTATFGPNIATALAGLWTSQVSSQFIFLEDIPLCTLSSVLVWYGVRRWCTDWSTGQCRLIGLDALDALQAQRVATPPHSEGPSSDHQLAHL